MSQADYFNYLLVFVVAVVSAVLTLLTKKYRHTFGFLFSIPHFYGYLFYFGIVGCFCLYLIEVKIIDSNLFEDAKGGITLKVVTIGLLSYAISQVKLESKIGNQTQKFSISSIFHYFDGWLEQKMNDLHSVRLKAYIQNKYADTFHLDNLRNFLIGELYETNHSSTIEEGFRIELAANKFKGCVTSEGLLKVYLAHYGAKRLKSTMGSYDAGVTYPIK